MTKKTKAKAKRKGTPRSARPDYEGYELVEKGELPKPGDWLELEFTGVKRVESSQNVGKSFLVLSGVIHASNVLVPGASVTLTCGAVLESTLLALRPALLDMLLIERLKDLPAKAGRNPAKNFKVGISRQEQGSIPPVLHGPGLVLLDTEPGEDEITE